MRSVLKKMMHQTGRFQAVEEASDGEEAWQKLRLSPFDLVIADINMPRLDGLGLLKRCRQEIDLRDLPFLMISGDALFDIVAGAGEWGAYDYVVKPFSYKTIIDRIDGIFGKLKNPEETLFREVTRLRDDGLFEEAVAKIEQIEKKFSVPKPKWLNIKGECLMEMGKFEEASACIEKALELADNFLPAHKSNAALHQKLGNTGKAIQSLVKADNLSPTDLDRKLSLGRMLIAEGKDDDAKTYLTKVLKQAKDHEKEAYQMQVAGVYLDHGRFAEAEEIYIKVLKSNPEGIEALNRLGIALRRQKKFKEAENYYKMALKYHTENPAIFYNLGILYASMQDKPAAISHLKQALKLDPEFKPAQEMLANLV